MPRNFVLDSLKQRGQFIATFFLYNKDMNNTEILAIFKRLKSIAGYFSKKTPKGITFRDADKIAKDMSIC